MIPELPDMQQVVGILFLAWILVLAWLAALTLFLIEIHVKVRRIAAKQFHPPAPAPAGTEVVERRGSRAEPVVPGPARFLEPIQDVEVLSEDHDITDMVTRVARKYRLLGFSLATSDGLLIASTDKGGDDDAARYSHTFCLGERPPESGVSLLGIRHKGSDLIAIIRSPAHPAPDVLHSIRRDIENILDWWL